MFVVLDLQWLSMGKGIAGDLKSECEACIFLKDISRSEMCYLTCKIAVVRLQF